MRRMLPIALGFLAILVVEACTPGTSGDNSGYRPRPSPSPEPTLAALSSGDAPFVNCNPLAQAMHGQGTTIPILNGEIVKRDDCFAYIEERPGTGPAPQAGQTVTVHYTGWLIDSTKFDSSVDSGRPFQFVLGTGAVIKGWDEGVAQMRVGGKRRLIIPPTLGYGERGAGGTIPPNSVLIFDVELLSVQ